MFSKEYLLLNIILKLLLFARVGISQNWSIWGVLISWNGWQISPKKEHNPATINLRLSRNLPLLTLWHSDWFEHILPWVLPQKQCPLISSPAWGFDIPPQCAMQNAALSLPANMSRTLVKFPSFNETYVVLQSFVRWSRKRNQIGHISRWQLRWVLNKGLGQ